MFPIYLRESKEYAITKMPFCQYTLSIWVLPIPMLLMLLTLIDPLDDRVILGTS